MNISIWALFFVFVVTAVRKMGPVTIKIWQAMTGGAILVLVTGEISWSDAIAAIDLDVLLFLLSMFIIGQALVASGFLFYLGYRLFGRLQSVPLLIMGILFGAACGSALLMNDTLAIIGTPLVLRIAREHQIDSKLLLLTLAFAITIGSVMSPIGNPQNLLIASQGHLAAPFQTFFSALAIPTGINLIIAYLTLRWAFRRHFVTRTPLKHNNAKLLDQKLARLARASLAILLTLVIINIALAGMHSSISIKLSVIAMIAALPSIVFNAERRQLLKNLDWSTLLFFAAMFVLMASVWQSGTAQHLISNLQVDLTTIPSIMALSSLLSQLISNVPLVALYLPILNSTNPELLMALAAGSTIAGNFLILGAASNVIIIEQAEKRHATLGFIEFARAGIPLGIINLLIYWAWLCYWYH